MHSLLKVRQRQLTRSLHLISRVHLGLKPRPARRVRRTRILQLVRSPLPVLRRKPPKPKSARGSNKLTSTYYARLFEV